jgi:dUTPase
MLSITKFSEDAIVPTRANPCAAGLDVYSSHDAWVFPGKVAKIGTGIGIELLPHHCGYIINRSGQGTEGLVAISGM